MKRTLLAASALALTASTLPAMASSHREAPMIAGMPRLDASDFYMFRSYDPKRADFVTMIADYVPLQDPGGGPNFYQMEDNGYYDINIDQTGSGKPTFAYRFRFSKRQKDLALNIGGMKVAIPLINDGPITAKNRAVQNVVETYTVSLVTFSSTGVQTEQLLSDDAGRTVVAKPSDNIGDKSIANYAEYAMQFSHEFHIPGCPVTGHLFIGQRKDPFVVNLGETFDLVNYANPVGEQYNNSTMDDLAGKNVTSIVWEAPIACITNGTEPVIGAWTTSSLGVAGKGGAVTYQQVSRLANPLVNELVIGLPDKDKFNASLPADDAQFAKYVTNPTVPALIEALFGTKAPTQFPRQDLVAVFLTGVPGLNQPATPPTPSEEMRLNTSIAPTPYGSQNRLGVIGGDNAGYPNGRRPGDDVVDITLRVAMGRLYTLGFFGGASNAPSGGLDFTDGAYTDDTHYLPVFPVRSCRPCPTRISQHTSRIDQTFFAPFFQKRWPCLPSPGLCTSTGQPLHTRIGHGRSGAAARRHGPHPTPRARRRSA